MMLVQRKLLVCGRESTPALQPRSHTKVMFEIVKAGGIMMGPIILASIVAAAIFLERLWTLQNKRVLPAELTQKVWRWVEQQQIQDKHIAALQQNSPLGKILAAGLMNRYRDRTVIRESIEDTGRHVVHELERFIGTLGTIASLSPLMGLLGTVFGMIRTFNAITTAGIGNPASLAGGIAEALITTAAGLTVAIPALLAYKYLRARVQALVVQMEKEAMKLVEALEVQAAQDAEAAA
jgi:biopolymer transport protein ExbB